MNYLTHYLIFKSDLKNGVQKFNLTLVLIYDNKCYFISKVFVEKESNFFKIF